MSVVCSRLVTEAFHLVRLFSIWFSLSSVPCNAFSSLQYRSGSSAAFMAHLQCTPSPPPLPISSVTPDVRIAKCLICSLSPGLACLSSSLHRAIRVALQLLPVFKSQMNSHPAESCNYARYHHLKVRCFAFGIFPFGTLCKSQQYQFLFINM